MINIINVFNMINDTTSEISETTFRHQELQYIPGGYNRGELFGPPHYNRGELFGPPHSKRGELVGPLQYTSCTFYCRCPARRQVEFDIEP